ncbi:urocanate hydratase [Clostridium sp. DJ247]|uniref:urocanate hydratase n=1 Tax=Clostridium sp. DJ247 TaxID=2726188 RepID=UPI001627EAD3|nr:urocanate hydratase [Clostridium sp. DJ247]MBC2582641.1 urocanate hydratase [Clostridium sp. DJ247]
MTKIRAQRGIELRCKGWRQEALLRMLENVLENGENQSNLIVYASLAKAARNWDCYNAIVNSLKNLNEDETLIIQSGKPIGVLKTHKYAPIVLMANCNTVGKWANSEKFYELMDKELIIWGGLTAADWQYIGSQGVVQGTYEIFATIGRKHFNGDLKGKFILTAGCGGMGGSQPLAGVMVGAAIIVVDVNEKNIDKRISVGYLQKKTSDLDQALSWIKEAQAKKETISVGLVGNAADIYTEILEKGIVPDIITDQTAAHDLLYGYIPSGYTLKQVETARKHSPEKLIYDSGKSIAKEVQAMLEFKKKGSIVFDNGNNIRTQAFNYGVKDAFDIDIFTEAFLRHLFCRAIGPFRWVALSGEKEDLETIDNYILEEFKDNEIVINWINLAQKYIPIEGLPARIGWLGHEERTKLALAVNEMVKNGMLKAPVAFTRDHLDAGAMTHPNIMTERMKDGSDGISDWPLLNAMINCSSMADLVAIHSGGGGYSGYMTSAGVTIVADGSMAAGERLKHTLDNDTSIGVLRYADAGYEEALDEVAKKKINRVEI